MRGAECSHHKPGPPTPLWQVAENSQRKNYDSVEYRGRAALQRRVEYQNQFGLQPQWSHVVSTPVVRQPLDFSSVNLCVPPVFKHFSGSISRHRHFETAAAKVSLLYDFGGTYRINARASAVR